MVTPVGATGSKVRFARDSGVTLCTVICPTSRLDGQVVHTRASDRVHASRSINADAFIGRNLEGERSLTLDVVHGKKGVYDEDTYPGVIANRRMGTPLRPSFCLAGCSWNC